MSAPNPDQSDPKALTTLLVGLIGFALVMVTVIGTDALYRATDDAEFRAKNYGVVPAELSRLRSQQLEELHSYRWIDQSKGVVGIPIDRAMELMVREQAAKR